MREYLTTATIAAPPAAVWAVLTDAARYTEWNPEIVGVAGAFAVGSRVVASVRLGDGAIRRVPQRVTVFEAPSTMQWRGGLPFGLFVGRRTFTVMSGPAGKGSEFRMHLRMSGPLASMILKSVGDRQPEIDAFSAALKARVESLAR